MRENIITFGFLVVCICLFSISGCTEKATYLEFKDVPGSNWNYSDTLTYTLQLEEDLSNPELELVVRNSSVYAFQNFWVHIDHYQDSVKVDEFRHEIFLADNAGRWLGKKSGALYTTYTPLTLSEGLSGKNELRITQVMRKNPLEGIQSVGVKVK